MRTEWSIPAFFSLLARSPFLCFFGWFVRPRDLEAKLRQSRCLYWATEVPSDKTCVFRQCNAVHRAADCKIGMVMRKLLTLSGILADAYRDLGAGSSLRLSAR